MARSRQTKTSSLEPPERVLDLLQRFIRSNPLVSLVAGFVGVSGIVAGVMTYFTNERIANNEIKHESEVAQVKTLDKAELLAVTTPLNQRIEDLNFRLASIERRVPGAGPLYLDITTITKGSDIRQTMFSGRYTSYDNDGFYVAVPPGNWKFEITNELSLINSTYPFMSKGFARPEIQKLAQVLAKSPVFLWQGNSNAQVFVENPSGEEQDFILRPSISVQHITSGSLKEQIEAATEIKGHLDLMMEDIKRKLDEAATKLNNVLDEVVKAKQNTEEAKTIEAAKIKLLNDPTTNTRQDIIQALEDLASGELTNYVLFSELGRMTPQKRGLAIQT